MRLLHARDLNFQDFFDQDIPSYAIVSHRWSKEEVSYHDFLDDRAKLLTGQCKGYGWTKIAKACEIASQRGLDWVWLDTCCIDKKSSAELSEAINSMFSWYSRSKECYVFLPDVHEIAPSETTGSSAQSEREVQNEFHPRYGNFLGKAYEPFNSDAFMASEWFTRAWTLQELLGPSDVYFFNSQFNVIGSKNLLGDLISEASNIPCTYLTSARSKIFEACVAERMKWASKRKATREEDVAYSLLGLFDVNMPLLYGEGKKAFRRLQTEIIKISADESIFVWRSDASDDPKGLLAPDVTAFTLSVYQHFYFARQHYEVTNKGIRIALSVQRRRLVEILCRHFSAIVLVPLNCALNVEDVGGPDVRSVLCLRILVNDDPQWANSMEPVSPHLKYLLGRRLSLELVQIRKCHRLQISKAVEDFVHSTESPGEWFSDLVASLGTGDEVDIPIYFWTR